MLSEAGMGYTYEEIKMYILRDICDGYIALPGGLRRKGGYRYNGKDRT